MSGVPYFSSEDAGGSEHEFLCASVLAIGWETSEHRWEYASFETNPGVIYHLDNTIILIMQS